MEIALKVPLIEKYYSTVAGILIGLRYTLLIGGVVFAIYLGPISVIMILVSFVLLIVNSFFKNYKVIGEIIFGYHSIRVNGERFPITKIEKIFNSFDKKPGIQVRKLPPTVSVTNNVICFYVDGVKQNHRVLLNDNDMEALVFLMQKWEELYGLKMGRLT